MEVQLVILEVQKEKVLFWVGDRFGLVCIRPISKWKGKHAYWASSIRFKHL